MPNPNLWDVNVASNRCHWKIDVNLVTLYVAVDAFNQTHTGVILQVWPMGRWPATPLEAEPTGARWEPAVRWAVIEDTGCWGRARSTASPADAGLGPLIAAVCGIWDLKFPIWGWNLLKTHVWATLLHSLLCSLVAIYVETRLYFESVPHWPSCCCKITVKCLLIFCWRFCSWLFRLSQMICVVMFLQGCVVMCCTSFHMADTPALMAFKWTPGVTSPATPAIASRRNTHAPVSMGGHGVEHSQFAQVHIKVLFFFFADPWPGNNVGLTFFGHKTLPQLYIILSSILLNNWSRCGIVLNDEKKMSEF